MKRSTEEQDEAGFTQAVAAVALLVGLVPLGLMGTGSGEWAVSSEQWAELVGRSCELHTANCELMRGLSPHGPVFGSHARWISAAKQALDATCVVQDFDIDK